MPLPPAWFTSVFARCCILRSSLTVKLSGSVALLAAIAIGIGLQASASTNALVHRFSAVVRTGTAGVAASADVESAVSTMSNLDRGIALSFLSGDTVLVTQFAREFDAAAKLLEIRIKMLSEFTTSRDAADARVLEKNFASWLPGHKKMLAAGTAHRPDAVNDVLLSELVPFAGEMADAASNIRLHAQEAAGRQSAEATASGEHARRIIEILLLGAALLALAPIAIVYRIVRLIAKLESAIAKIGERDLTVRLKAGARQGELGRLSGALNGSLESLCAVMQSVRRESASLIESADDLTVISEEIAMHSSTSERSASAVSDAAQGIANGIGGVADAAREMTQSVNEVLLNTAAAHKMASETDDTIRQASVMTGQVAKVVENIGGIVDLVQMVAHQTNLLALNASIEAAHVGDAGRGFAVVAREIRNLAAETAASVKQIQASIQAAQKFTFDVTGYMQVVSQQSAKMNVISTDIARLVAAQSVAAGEIERNASDVSHDTQIIAESMNNALYLARSASERATRTMHAASKVRVMALTVGDSIGQFALENGSTNPGTS